MKYEDEQYYHVYNRGAHRRRIFAERDNYLYCLNLMGRYTRPCRVDVFGYCLLPNHYHWVVRQNEQGSISKFIQNTFNSYSQAFNLRYNHSGTLFQGRAKAKLIVNETYVLQVVRYVHRNPVNAGLARWPGAWEFSDCRVWCGEVLARLTNLSLRDSHFGSGKEYAAFVLASDGDLGHAGIGDLVAKEGQ